MNNNDQIQQNGRQRPLPPHHTSPQQSSSSDGICRDFVWGICGKGTQCRFRHVLNFESMKKILKFCHNFQNKRGCNSCTYLHTSSEEESLFLRTGQIPRVLRERYATMAMSNPGNVYLNEILSQPPPPPPPPPPLPPQAIQSPHSTLPPGLAPLPAPLSTLLAPPPPPPPPTATTTTVQMRPPIYTGPVQINATRSPQPNLLRSQPLNLNLFDATRPPPPLPSIPVVHRPNGALKRTASTALAGPSKCRKVAGARVVDHSQCEKCSHRKNRADELTEQARALDYGEKYQKRVIDERKDAIENGKLLLKSVLSPAMYRIWDEFIEGCSSSERRGMNDMLNIAQNVISAGARPTTIENDTNLTIQTILKRVLSLNTKAFGGTRRINNSAATPANLVNTSPIAAAGTSRQVFVQGCPNLSRTSNPQDVNRFQQNGAQMQATHSPNITHMQPAAHRQNMSHQRAAGLSNLQPTAPSQNGMSFVPPPIVYEQQHQAGVPPQPSTSYMQYPVASNNLTIRHFTSPRPAANQANINIQQPGPSVSTTTTYNRFNFNTTRYPGPHPPPPQ